MSSVPPVPENEAERLDAQRLGLRVLVAEDNLVNQRVARRMLEKLGCHVTLVENGRQAVDRAGDGFDAILMDCRMPEMDGYDAAAAIIMTYASPPPIIALTASAVLDDQARYLEAGMVGFLSKPVRTASLAAALITHAVSSRAQ